MKIKYSFEQWCLDNNHQDWLDLWDNELNDKNPCEVPFRSHKKRWFKCPTNKHSSELKDIHNAVVNNHVVCCQCNSFGQFLLDEFGENAINIYWSNKNDIFPFTISKLSSKEIWVKCINYNHPDYKTTPAKFCKGKRCAVCSNQRVIYGINSIYDTNPELVKYFVDIEDAKYCTVQCGKKKRCKCPHCGYQKDIFIYNLVKQGFGCPICSDGISYPNKFMGNVLLQIQKQHSNVFFETEKTFEWSKNVVHDNPKLCGSKRYDFYICAQNKIIVECHGKQHYDDVFFNGTNRRKTLDEEKENDNIKQALATDYCVSKDRYVVIDCSKSTMEFMRNSIMQSNLPNLLDFKESDIDWAKCEKTASNSLLIQCCDLWNSGVKSATKIAKIVGISCSTSSKYLRKGDDIGLCKYIK